jgi:ABC-type xylose transport system permease subunit
VQYRQGPPWFQPFADILKLLGKEICVPEGAPQFVFLAAPLLGLAAVILVARLTTSTEALGTGMELTAVSATVIGGVSLQGGLGSALGPCMGAFLLGVLLTGLTLAGFSQYVQQIITGAILIGAVWYDRILSHRRRRATEGPMGGARVGVA